MKSKRFIKIGIMLSITILMILISIPLINGAYLSKSYDLSSDHYDNEKTLMSEEEFMLIKAGMSAASSHNMQPWKVMIVDEQHFTIHLDSAKYLEVVDPDNVQAMMGIGGFIASMENQANAQEITISIEYEDEILFNSSYPLVATVSILSSNALNEDFIAGATYLDNITHEVNNFNADQMLAPFFENEVFTSLWMDNDLDDFKQILHEATVIESNDEEAMNELLSIFRFSRRDKNATRYGLSLNTIKPPVQFYIESLIGWTSSWESFGKSSIKTFDQRLKDQFGYLIISKETPHLLDYLRVGYITQRIIMQTEGLYIRPAVQLIQPLDGMDALSQQVCDQYQISGDLMMVLGFQYVSQEGYYESIRHHVLDIIIT